MSVRHPLFRLLAFLVLAFGSLAIAWGIWPQERRVERFMQDPAATVVLVTLDGARLFEVLGHADPLIAPNARPDPVMPDFNGVLVPQGRLLGDRRRNSAMRMGQTFGISMPGYHAIFAGRWTACATNECGAPMGETLLSRIQRDLPRPAAFFSAYRELCAGVRADDDAGPVDCALEATTRRPHTLNSGPDMSRDLAALALARDSLQQDPPPLVYLGLDQSDVIAHSGDYGAFLNVLGQYDQYLMDLWADVERLNAQGHKTTLLITVDHGRGRGADWTQHRWDKTGSAEVWVFAAGHGVAPRGVLADTPRRSLFDIRATVENLLGLPPRKSLWGNVMVELLD